ncbi:PAS domain-containing sensor histidine kinase [Sphingomonas ginkgonis]|uniref:histidine kinase n=1 Tax=Sphingomonas ginkgonis TaxID=2315330 RepID=A0A429VA93_9SPHN|nr:PAS domain-containing sensor histidine kinase [Sphingomonas ginkgonis]RST30846.1 PAS domain-containing sensor histidine kinase [Sphingomonas ginkgonis]
MMWVIGGVAAVWVAVAVALSVRAAAQLRRANRLIATLRSLGAVLAAAPVRPVEVGRDGAIRLEPRLAAELGLDGSGVARLSDLSQGECGIEAEDLAALADDVAASALSGGRFERTVRLAGSRRVMDVRGAPAPSPAEPGTLLLWLGDATSAESEKLALGARLRQTEAALESLTHLIESAPFPMWYRAADLRLGLVNSAYVAAVEGRDAADVIQRGAELIDSPDDDSPRAAAKAALEHRHSFTRSQPATIGGERRMMKVVDVPLPTGAVAGFAIDIQDLEDARFELGRHIESQRELADRLTAGVAQFEADRTLSFFNQPFAIMARIEPEWLNDAPEFDRVLERMRESNRLPETRDFPLWKGERRAWFTATEEALEEEWILANGDHIRVVGQPLPDGGLRLILEDRTEQVRLASARDTLLRVRTATFDNLFEAISVFAADGRLYLWNNRFGSVWDLDESWLAEHPRVDELVPAMARRLVNPTAAAQLRELIRAATTERRQGGGRINMADGRNFDFAAVPLPDGNALLTMIDVTDSARIESALRERATALEQADRVKTDFVANMSYELRTPLTSIGGFAEMLAGGYAGGLTPAAADYVHAILEAVARLSRLIDDVLDLTQGDRHGVALERDRIDLGGLCRMVAEGLQSGATARQLSFKTIIQPSAGAVIGDSRRLREVFEHVLGNAITYTDEGGSVTFEAAGNDHEAIVTIVDNGPGIAPEDQKRVFDRFTRIGGTHGEAALGLGLPLTRQFIEAHGGGVELVSAPGQGTAVTLTIPRGRR